MRVLVSTVIAGLVIAIASGCGGGHPAAVRLAYTSITRHQAQAVARAVNIRAGDLPEFKAVAHPPVTQAGMEAADDLSCASPLGHRRSPSQVAWASARSDRLSAGGGYHALGAFSRVLIMRTAAAARLNIAESTHLDHACLKRAIRRAVASEFHVRQVVVKPVAITVPGADESVAYQTIIGVHGVPLILYMDSIAFAYGQDMVTLTTYHSSRPVPRSMEERLLGLLVARARSHTR